MKRRPRHWAIAAMSVALACCGVVVLVGSSTPASAKAKPLYEIAFVGPLTGPQAPLATRLELAARLAVQQANASTLLPFRLALVTYDTKDDPLTRALVDRKLVANQRVVAVVGPSTNEGVATAAPLFARARLAMVTPSASATSLATSGYKNFFRVVPADDVQGLADANFLVRSQGSRSVFVVSDGSSYGASMAEAVSAQARVDGASVTNQLAPATSQCAAGTGEGTQYAGVAMAALVSQATSLFYGGYACDFGLLLNALHVAGFHGVILSDDGANSPILLHSVSPTTNDDGVYLSCGCVASATGSFGHLFAAIAHASVAQSPYAAEAYDATKAIIAVMKSVKTITRAALASALRHVVYHGVSRIIKFRANGNIEATTSFLSQVQGGKIVPLGFS